MFRPLRAFPVYAGDPSPAIRMGVRPSLDLGSGFWIRGRDRSARGERGGARNPCFQRDSRAGRVHRVRAPRSRRRAGQTLHAGRSRLAVVRGPFGTRRRGRTTLRPDGWTSEADLMRGPMAIVRLHIRKDPACPDLQTQLEDLLAEVWSQESFERRHPLTCATMREPVRRAARPGGASPDQPAFEDVTGATPGACGKDRPIRS